MKAPEFFLVPLDNLNSVNDDFNSAEPPQYNTHYLFGQDNSFYYDRDYFNSVRNPYFHLVFSTSREEVSTPELVCKIEGSLAKFSFFKKESRL